MRIDDGYRVFEYGLLLAANEVEEGGLRWVAVGILRVIDAAVASTRLCLVMHQWSWLVPLSGGTIC